jgi:hypothetical protein
MRKDSYILRMFAGLFLESIQNLIFRILARMDEHVLARN